MAALKVVPLLSRKACYEFAGFAGRVAATFDRRGMRVAISNLEAAFGDEFSPARRKEIARESYEHFARTMLDLFWSPRLNAQDFERYIEFENLDRARAEIAPTNSCIVGTFHYGNFEWLGLASAWIGYPCAITTQEFKNPLLDCSSKDCASNPATPPSRARAQSLSSTKCCIKKGAPRCWSIPLCHRTSRRW